MDKENKKLCDAINKAFRDKFGDMDERGDEDVDFDERAAICEFDGGLIREEAEQQAMFELIERMKK